MRGVVLGYHEATGEGVLSSQDGGRYSFSGGDWRGGLNRLVDGAEVDFEAAADGRARELYPVAAATVTAAAPVRYGDAAIYPKSPIAAGLLALFLGTWGIHKFYLGYNAQGIILLCGTLASLLLSIIVIGIFGLMAIGLVCLIEAIIYLTKNAADFNATYVENRKPWF